MSRRFLALLLLLLLWTTILNIVTIIMFRSSAVAARVVLAAAANTTGRRALSSAKPAAAAAPKEILPRNASMGLAAAGLFVMLAAGASQSAKAEEDAATVQLKQQQQQQQEEAQQVAEIIALINQRMDRLEQMVETERAAREEAKRVKVEAKPEEVVKAAEEAKPAEPAVEEKPVEEKPAEEKPATEEKPAEEKPAEEKPATEEKPAEEKPVEEKPAEAVEAPAATEAAPEAKAAEEEKQALIVAASATNRAFIFVKPHANTEKVDQLVKETLAKQGFVVKAEGTLTAEEIDSKKLIDNHYGAIASKAVLQKPSELNVPAKGKTQFQETFGLSWEDALAKGQVLNAAEACEKLKVDGDQLEAIWRDMDKKKLIKFGGGFYCGEVEPGLFVINGFYMQMRGKYTRPPASIRFFEVEWNPASLPWKAFREQFLGATDPSKAAEGSLRRTIYERWEELGLPAKPDTGDNGMHGSASPFEALAEVANWEGKSISEDVFGKGLFAASGLDEATLKLWLADAQVPVNGKLTSIFDTLEDQDSKENLEKIAEIVSKLPAKVVQ